MVWLVFVVAVGFSFVVRLAGCQTLEGDEQILNKNKPINSFEG